MAEDLNREWSEDQCGKNRTSVNEGKPFLQMTLDGEELRNVDHFKYLGSVIDADVHRQRRGPSRAGSMVKLEKIHWSIV